MSDEKDSKEEEGEGTTLFPSELKVKREYKLSESALEARRQNAKLSTGPKTDDGKKASSRNSWKHGLYAQSFIMGVLSKTCKSTCPEYFTCQFINDGATTPGDKCLDRQHMVEAFGSIIDAIEHGNHTGFREMAAFEMAGGIEILRKLKESIIEDGVVIKSEKHDKDGSFISYEYKMHPALVVYNQMLEKQGLTFKDFNLTPKQISTLDEHGKDKDSPASIMAKAFVAVAAVKVQSEPKPE